MLISLLGHSFLNKFGARAEVRYWSIVLQGISVKICLLEQGCDICSLEAGRATALLKGKVHNICARDQEYANTITDSKGRNGV